MHFGTILQYNLAMRSMFNNSRHCWQERESNVPIFFVSRVPVQNLPSRVPKMLGSRNQEDSSILLMSTAEW